MAFENLLKSIDESAREREHEIREKATAAAAAIMKEAKDQAAAIRQAHLNQARKSAAIERHRALYLANSEEKKALIRVQETLFARAFETARNNLANIRGDPDYPEILARLVREAVDLIGNDDYRIHADARDEALVKKILSQTALFGGVVPDITCCGGVVVTSRDDAVTISNTIESRLERTKERRKLEIYAILTGD